MQPQITFASSPQEIQDFKSDTQLCVIYVEWKNRILTFPLRQANWDLPADRMHAKEQPIDAAMRILKEKATLVIEPQALISHGLRYARGLGPDTVLHFYRVKLAQMPDQLSTASWVSIFAYRYLHLMRDNQLCLDARPPEDGRLEAFGAVYDSLLWHPIPNPVAGPAAVAGIRILLQRGNAPPIEFNLDKRLIIPILGIAASGKKTQSLLLNKVLGIPSTSTRELFSNEGGAVRNMVTAYGTAFEGQPLPDELPIGMIATRISTPDCLAGVILRGFPVTDEQCRALVDLFRRNTDLLVPFYLNIKDDINDRIPVGERGLADNRSRMMLAHKKAVCERLRTHDLDLEGKDSISEVFHQILQHLQAAFDAEEMRRAALLRERVVQAGGRDVVRREPPAPTIVLRGDGGAGLRDTDERSPLVPKDKGADDGEKCCVML